MHRWPSALLLLALAGCASREAARTDGEPFALVALEVDT